MKNNLKTWIIALGCGLCVASGNIRAQETGPEYFPTQQQEPERSYYPDNEIPRPREAPAEETGRSGQRDFSEPTRFEQGEPPPSKNEGPEDPYTGTEIPPSRRSGSALGQLQTFSGPTSPSATPAAPAVHAAPADGVIPAQPTPEAAVLKECRIIYNAALILKDEYQTKSLLSPGIAIQLVHSLKHAAELLTNLPPKPGEQYRLKNKNVAVALRLQDEARHAAKWGASQSDLDRILATTEAIAKSLGGETK